MKNKTSDIKDYVKLLNQLIEENMNDIEDDTISDYAKLRIQQNKQLEDMAFYFEGILDPSHGYQE